MPSHRDHDDTVSAIEFVDNIMHAIVQATTLSVQEAEKKVRQIFDVVNDLTAANQMMVFEICMIAQYDTLKDYLQHEGDVDDVDTEKLLALLLALRLTYGVAERLFQHLTVQYFPQMTVKDMPDDNRPH